MKKLTLGALIVLALTACSITEPELQENEKLPAITANSGDFVVKTPDVEIVKNPVVFTVLNAGDFLTGPEINRYFAPNSYNYSSLLEPALPAVESADLAVCHLEILSSSTGPSFVMREAPVFTNPYSTLQQLKNYGWDACSAASNHSMDGGFSAIQDTRKSASEAGIQITGVSDSDEGAGPLLITLEKDGVELTIGIVSYTWALNGLSKPAGKPWAVNTFSRFDLSTLNPLIEDARTARAEGADVVMASVHCCQEYITTPSASQIAISEYIAESGEVDVLIGHHPHTPQPINMISGGPNNQGMWVAYSIGNYTSYLGKAWTDIGILSLTDFTVSPEDGSVSTNMRYTTITTSWDGGLHTILGGDSNTISSVMTGSDASYQSFAGE